jgi:hypothetical protein
MDGKPILLLVVTFACGGASNAASSTAPVASSSASSAPPAPTVTSVASTTPATPEPLVIAPMKLAGGPVKKPVELQADGTVVVDGKPAAKIVGSELHDASGKTLISVRADDTVALDGTDAHMKFDLKDTLLLENGNQITLADDGSVHLINADKTADAESGKMKFTGFVRRAARTCVVMVLAVAARKI